MPKKSISIDIQTEEDQKLWDEIMASYVASRYGKIVAVGLAGIGVEPVNMTVEGIVGDKLVLSIPLVDVVDFDDDKY